MQIKWDIVNGTYIDTMEKHWRIWNCPKMSWNVSMKSDIMIASKKSKRGIQQWVPFLLPISRRLKLRASGTSFCREDSQDWNVRQ